MEVSFDVKFYQVRPETAQEWRDLSSQSDRVFVEPDKFYIKRQLSIYHTSLEYLKAFR